MSVIKTEHDDEMLPHRMVRASAGTGKTYTLTLHYIKLLRYGASPDTILATTFTRKAAGEIISRLLLRLANAAINPDAADRLAQALNDPYYTATACADMLDKICRVLHRLSICTIDSFFNRMVHCLGPELDVPGDVTIVADNDPRAVQLRRRAIDAMLGDDDLHVMLDLIRRIQHDSAQRSVTDAIDRIVTGRLYEFYRQNPDERVWSQLQPPASLLDQVALAELLESLALFMADEDDTSWGKALLANHEAAIDGNWQDMLSKGLAKAIVSGKSTYYRRDIPENLRDIYQKLIGHARADLVAQVARQTRATHDLLRRFDEHYAQLRRHAGVLLYADLPHKLARQLPAMDVQMIEDLYFRLDGRVLHMMLDEFQDTSVEQWSVLAPFAAEICAHGEPDPAAARSFFCVGDTKQAIYGWRGGCAELFDQIENDLHLPGGMAHHLHKSYRTGPIVLDTINTLFGSLADNDALERHRSRAERWQAGFVNHEAARIEQPGYVELVTSISSDRDEADSDQADGTASSAGDASGHDQFVADRIAGLVDAVPGRDVGVLVRTNRKVAMLIHLLRQRGVAASGEGGTTITDDPAVNVVLSALTLADHPGNRVAAYHVANSPLGPLINLDSTRADRCEAVSLAVRRAVAAEGYGRVLTRWAAQMAGACNHRSAARLVQLLELADAYRPVGADRPADFVFYAATATVADPSPASVRVMTIHKAKGLEFDIVVLPQLDANMLRSADELAYVNRPDPTGSVDAIYRSAVKQVCELCPELQGAFEQQVDRVFNDGLCALYVAMTRPRYALHMIVPPLEMTGKGDIAARGWSTPSCAAILRRGLCETKEGFAGNEMLYMRGNADWALSLPIPAQLADVQSIERASPPRLEVKPSPAQPHRSLRRVAPSSIRTDGHTDVRDLLDLDPTGPHLRGSLIHAWLELIEWLDGDSPLPDDAALIAVAHRVAPGVGEGWLTDQIGCFRETLGHRAVRQALVQPSSPHDLWRERRFAVELGGNLIEGAFDRVTTFREQGVAVGAELIDFKTNRIDPQQADELLETYRGQIETYRKALAKILQLDFRAVRAALLLWELPQLVEL